MLQDPPEKQQSCSSPVALTTGTLQDTPGSSVERSVSATQEKPVAPPVQSTVASTEHAGDVAPPPLPLEPLPPDEVPTPVESVAHWLGQRCSTHEPIWATGPLQLASSAFGAHAGALLAL